MDLENIQKYSTIQFRNIIWNQAGKQNECIAQTFLLLLKTIFGGNFTFSVGYLFQRQ